MKVSSSTINLRSKLNLLCPSANQNSVALASRSEIKTHV